MLQGTPIWYNDPLPLNKEDLYKFPGINGVCYRGIQSFNYILSLSTHYVIIHTVEPLSKGHFGTSHFVPCREVVLFSEVEMYCIYTFGDIGSVLCREVVPFSEGPLLEVPLYTHYVITLGILLLYTTHWLIEEFLLESFILRKKLH